MRGALYIIGRQGHSRGPGCRTVPHAALGANHRPQAVSGTCVDAVDTAPGQAVTETPMGDRGAAPARVEALTPGESSEGVSVGRGRSAVDAEDAAALLAPLRGAAAISQEATHAVLRVAGVSGAGKV